tara:strand:+ start:7 stop:189 length:183 start_codon:yes stop_codon:yes gene_type:complete
MKGVQMLSRKYYVLIAKAIKSNTFNNNRKLNKDTLINDLCAEFKRDNNLFSADRFVDACE